MSFNNLLCGFDSVYRSFTNEIIGLLLIGIDLETLRITTLQMNCQIHPIVSFDLSYSTTSYVVQI